MNKSVSCSCGHALVDQAGKFRRRTMARFHDDSLYLHCPRCQGDTKMGQVMGSEEPKAKKSIRKSGVRIVYVPGKRR